MFMLTISFHKSGFVNLTVKKLLYPLCGKDLGHFSNFTRWAERSRTRNPLQPKAFSFFSLGFSDSGYIQIVPYRAAFGKQNW